MVLAPLTRDRLVWIRRNNDINDNDWWPAVYCNSHIELMRDFGHRMTEALKMKAVLKSFPFQGPNIPVAVPLPVMGKDHPVTRLVDITIVTENEDNESDTLRRDFCVIPYIREFSKRNAGSENDTAYQACIQELRELIDEVIEQEETADTVEASSSLVQDLLEVQVETADTVEASSSPAVTSRTCRRLFRQPALAEEHGTLSEGQELEEQDDLPIDNANNDDSDEDDDFAIPSIRLAIPWDSFWGDMESICGWVLRTGGRPYLYVKPGCNTRPGESKLGVDYFDNKEDVQAYACQRYGWRGNDHADVDHAPSPNRVEVRCPICTVLVLTFTQKDDAVLPLTTDGIADWNQPWPKGTENPLRRARSHFEGHLRDGILPNGDDAPVGIRFKYKKRDIEEQSGTQSYFSAYHKVRSNEKKLR
jgi:hypothetical protein